MATDLVRGEEAPALAMVDEYIAHNELGLAFELLVELGDDLQAVPHTGILHRWLADAGE